MFLALIFDGFDTAALSFAIPTLSADWGLPASAFTLPLVTTNIGAVVGYMSCGALCERFGRHRVVSGCVALFSAATLLTTVTTTVTTMSAVRLVAGFGFGLLLPAAVSLAADLVSGRRRDAVSVAVALGLATGATIGGFVGGSLIAELGWVGAFWLPGLLSVPLAGLLWWFLPPAAPSTDGSERPEKTGPGGLFVRSTRTRTVLLWSFSVQIFGAIYVLQSWMPTFLAEYGFSPQEAPIGTAALGIGGLVGGLLVVGGAALIGAPRMLGVMSASAVVFLASAALIPMSTTVLLVVVGGAGAGLIAGGAAQNAVALRLYGPRLGTTGVAWAAALGRAGSVAGPAIGGLLLALNQPPSLIILLTCVPVAVAVGCAVAIGRRIDGRPSETRETWTR